MGKFKFDDVVRCINFDGISNLNSWTTYKVNFCNEHYVSLNIDTGDGFYYENPCTFSVDRFELAEGEATYKHPAKQSNSYTGAEDEWDGDLSYVDCSGNVQELSQLHLHELIDRIHCIQVMIQELLMDHPASGLIGDKFRIASEQLSEGYQELGYIEHNEFIGNK